jgi:hypothetical protein
MMKLVTKALLTAGLVALSACGGGAEENVAANTAGEDLYNVTDEDLTLNGLTSDVGNDLGNVSLGNEADAGNASDVGNVTDSNTVGNSQ